MLNRLVEVPYFFRDWMLEEKMLHAITTVTDTRNLWRRYLGGGLGFFWGVMGGWKE